MIIKIFNSSQWNECDDVHNCACARTPNALPFEFILLRVTVQMTVGKSRYHAIDIFLRFLFICQLFLKSLSIDFKYSFIDGILVLLCDAVLNLWRFAIV